MDGLGDANTPGLCQGLDTGGQFDAIAVDVASMLDQVAQVHADSKPELLRFRRTFSPVCERSLYGDRAAHRVHR